MVRGKGFSNLLKNNKLSVAKASKDVSEKETSFLSWSEDDCVLTAFSNVGKYDTEVYSYRNHEIIVRRPNDGGCYEAFIGDEDYPVKGKFNEVDDALEMAKTEVDWLIKSVQE